MSTGKASDYEIVSQRHKQSEHCGCYPGFIQQFLFLRPYDLAEFLIVQTFKELMVRLLIASLCSQFSIGNDGPSHRTKPRI